MKIEFCAGTVLLWFFVVSMFAASSFAQDIERLEKGVVKIEASSSEGQRKVGTGFIVRLEQDAVYIVTASHVVEGAGEIEVEFFSRRHRLIPARVIGMEGGDPQGLAALLVREDIASEVSVLDLTNAVPVSKGDAVTTIGFPRISGVSWAVIKGDIVGRKGKTITFSGAVDEGNSGGPLIKEGQVIGVVTQVTEQFAYAIPTLIAQYVLEGWGIEFEEGIPLPTATPTPLSTATPMPSPEPLLTATPIPRTRGWLGVMIQSVTQEIAKSSGLKEATGTLVGDLLKDGPAEKAGIERGDVIISFDGKPIDGPNTLRNIVAQTEVGKKVPVVVIRDGKEKTIEVTIEEQEAGMQASTVTPAPLPAATPMLRPTATPTPLPTATPTPLIKWRELLTLRADSSYVQSVAWSPDGTRLVSGGYDALIHIWDAFNGKELHTLRGHPSLVVSVAWSPDGTRLASGDADNMVRVWDAKSGSLLSLLTGHTQAHFNRVNGVTWSPDGTKLASAGDDGTVRIWEAASGKQLRVLTVDRDNALSVAWSPDGTMLAAGGGDFEGGAALNGTVRVWEVASGQVLPVLEGYKGAVTSVAWSPDGTKLASVTYYNTDSVRMWDFITKTQLWARNLNTVWSVAWSPDGAQLAIGVADGTVRVWNADTGREIRALEIASGQVYSVDWSPNGERIVLGGGDGIVRIWGKP